RIGSRRHGSVCPSGHCLSVRVGIKCFGILLLARESFGQNHKRLRASDLILGTERSFRKSSHESGIADGGDRPGSPVAFGNVCKVAARLGGRNIQSFDRNCRKLSSRDVVIGTEGTIRAPAYYSRSEE